ncbi:MAG: 16S rRNA (uracil(1498)-N(3))-methyltransferase [Verrucomicrobiota bacterium]
MSVSRFFIPPGEWNPDQLVLSGSESKHCLEVLRHQVGDKVVVFNGQGVEATAEITSIEGQAIQLSNRGTVRNTPLSAGITLAQAIPKGKNMDLILQKATELGARRVVPLLSERTIVRLDDEEGRRKQEKWQRIAIEACKQCGQNWLPEVEAPMSMEAFLSGKQQPGELRLIASLGQGARPLPAILEEHEELHRQRPEKALVIVGPEGDFTPAEMADAIRFGCLPLSLGPIVLRTETAAIYTLSILAYELLTPRSEPVPG